MYDTQVSQYMWYLWILTKTTIMLCLSLPTTKAYVELIGVEKAWKSILTIHILLSHTIKSRCACVWIYMVANLILLCSLKTYLSFETWKQLCKKTWDILFISSFFQAGIGVLIVLYISNTCPFFSTLFFLFSSFHL